MQFWASLSSNDQRPAHFCDQKDPWDRRGPGIPGQVGPGRVETLGGLYKGKDRGRKKIGDELPKELIAKLALSKEEIAHLYHGGVLSIKIKGKETEVSVEISCKEFSEWKGTRLRFKTIDAE